MGDDMIDKEFRGYRDDFGLWYTMIKKLTDIQDRLEKLEKTSQSNRISTQGEKEFDSK
jgi:hypothetical protein